MDSSILVHAPVNLFHQVRGLCGTFTRNQQDDFFTPEGDIEMSSEVFAEKWKAEESCVDYSRRNELDKPCDRFPERRTFAARVCSVIREEDFEGEVNFFECVHDFLGRYFLKRYSSNETKIVVSRCTNYTKYTMANKKCYTIVLLPNLYFNSDTCLSTTVRRSLAYFLQRKPYYIKSTIKVPFRSI